MQLLKKENYAHIICLNNFLKGEPYLNVVNNRDVRKSFTRFRVSAHVLAIERGRYKNIKSENSICKNCQTQEIENEIHFLINCPKYSYERENLCSHVAKTCINFEKLSHQNKCIWLLSSEDTDIIIKVAYFIHKCFEIRKQTV